MLELNTTDVDLLFRLVLGLYAIFFGVLAHMWGDYKIQNHWMALRKGDRNTEGRGAVIAHGITYGLLFGLILALLSSSALKGGAAWIVIVGTHMAIDHFKWPRKWAMWYGNGTHGKVMPVVFPKATVAGDAPSFLGVWLIIIIDNIWHVSINTAVLLWAVSL